MRSYGIEFFVEERQRDLLREAEQARLLKEAAPVRGTGQSVGRVAVVVALRPLAAALRRLVQLAWAG